MKCYVKDYPRPQFVRKNWENLNGTWDFSFDDSNFKIDPETIKGINDKRG